MSYDDVLELPLRVFNLYNSNINRLKAEDEMRQLRVLAAASSGELMKSVYSSLQEELGELSQTEGVAYVPMESNAIDKLKGLQ